MSLKCLLFGMIFCIVGIVFAQGRLLDRIKGWDALTEEEKSQIRIVPLCRDIGTFIVIAGSIFIVAGISEYIREHFFVWLMIIWAVLSSVNIWWVEKKKLFIEK